MRSVNWILLVMAEQKVSEMGVFLLSMKASLMIVEKILQMGLMLVT